MLKQTFRFESHNYRQTTWNGWFRYCNDGVMKSKPIRNMFNGNLSRSWGTPKSEKDNDRRRNEKHSSRAVQQEPKPNHWSAGRYGSELWSWSQCTRHLVSKLQPTRTVTNSNRIINIHVESLIVLATFLYPKKTEFDDLPDLRRVDFL